MKKSELIKKLEKLPGDPDVFVPSSTGDYDYGRVHSVYEATLAMEDEDIEIEGIIIDE